MCDQVYTAELDGGTPANQAQRLMHWTCHTFTGPFQSNTGLDQQSAEACSCGYITVPMLRLPLLSLRPEFRFWNSTGTGVKYGLDLALSSGWTDALAHAQSCTHVDLEVIQSSIACIA